MHTTICIPGRHLKVPRPSEASPCHQAPACTSDLKSGILQPACCEAWQLNTARPTHLFLFLTLNLNPQVGQRGGCLPLHSCLPQLPAPHVKHPPQLLWLAWLPQGHPASRAAAEASAANPIDVSSSTSEGGGCKNEGFRKHNMFPNTSPKCPPMSPKTFPNLTLELVLGDHCGRGLGSTSSGASGASGTTAREQSEFLTSAQVCTVLQGISGCCFGLRGFRAMASLVPARSLHRFLPAIGALNET